MNKFNFIGVNPETLHVGSTVNVTSFYRDSNIDSNWSAQRSRICGFYNIIEINKINDNKYKLKLQSPKLSFGIHNKGYYPKMNITVNSNGQSNPVYSESAPKCSCRYVIYNAIIG